MDGKIKGYPTENVVIRNSTVKRSVGGMTIGSETAAMIKNIYMVDCIMENPNSGFISKQEGLEEVEVKICGLKIFILLMQIKMLLDGICSVVRLILGIWQKDFLCSLLMN